MVRKGSSVRVRQRAFRSSLLLRRIADLPDPADAARVFVKVPRRYRAGRHGFARLTNHVDRGAPRKALELLEDARVVPQARRRRVPELGCELDDVDAFVDEQLAKLPRRSRGRVSRGIPTAMAVGWKIRSRQLSQSLPVHRSPRAEGKTRSPSAGGHLSLQRRRSRASGSSSRVSRSTTAPLFVARNVIVRRPI
jgi:hypothetical protein